MSHPLIELDNVRRYYGAGDTEVRALDGVSLTINPGEFVAIVGQSGSGKSTLMNILGCLDRPTGGSYRVRGEDVSDFDADGLAALRRLSDYIEEPKAASECFAALFKRSIGEAEYGLALVEAVAHLSHLYQTGLATRSLRESDGAWVYQRKE